MRLRGLNSLALRALSIAAGLAALAALLLLGGAHQPSDVHADPTWPGIGNTHFEPTVDIALCNRLPNVAPFAGTPAVGDPGCTDAATSPNSPFDLTVRFDIPAHSITFSNLVNFMPGNVTTMDHSNIPPNGGGTPVVAGGLTSVTNLGVFNSPCNQQTGVNFLFYNVALPNHPTNPTNIAWPKEEGQAQRFNAWAPGGMTRPATFAANPGAFTELTGTSAPAASIPFERFPSYLIRVLSPSFSDGIGGVPDGDGYTLPNDFIMPSAVYGGLTIVQGNYQPLFFIQLPAGSLQQFAPPHPFSQFPSASGAPNLAVLTDPTTMISDPLNPINDLCSPVTTSAALLGQIGGSDRVRTPAGSDQTARFRAFTQSSRDLSGDGLENSLSLCPLEPVGLIDPGFPGTPTQPSAWRHAGQSTWITHCQVLDSGLSGNDWDGDTAANRLDNCELVPNSTQRSNTGTLTWAATAPDGGPKGDGIGDACSFGIYTHMTAAASSGATTISISSLKSGPGVTALAAGDQVLISPRTPNEETRTVASVSPGSLTLTSGLSNSHDAGTAVGVLNKPITITLYGATVQVHLSPDVSNGHYHAKAFTVNKCLNRTAAPHPSGACSTGTAANQSAAPGAAGAIRAYPQGGSWSPFVEAWIGTDIASTCSGTTGTGPSGHPAWPPDLNNDRVVNITDLSQVALSFLGALNPDGSSTGNYQERRDLNADGVVNITDLSIVAANFLATCTFTVQ